jgi:hypothetical protein
VIVDVQQPVSGEVSAPSEASAPPNGVVTPPAATLPSPFAALADAAVTALDPAWKPECPQSFRAALLTVTPLLPFLAVIAMVAIYAAPSPMLLSLFDPLLAGVAFAVIVGLGAAIMRWKIIEDTSADRANSSGFDAIRERLGAITARLAVTAVHVDDDEGRQFAVREVQAYRAQILAELKQSGPSWVLGTGYMSIWKLIHRAEEALLELEPVPTVVAAALYDEQRLTGSPVDNRDQLLTRLRLAVMRLDPNSMAFLNQQPVPPAVGTTPTAPDTSTLETARSVLREVRTTINEFRDGSWGAILRTRNHLLHTMTLTGIVTLFGLMLALDLSKKTTDYDPRTDAVIAAVVFYLVGAMVGLFNRLSSESSADNDLEDYGLTEVRVSLTPVLSGLAAVGGVFLTAMITNTLSGVVGASTGTSVALPTVASIFNLSVNPFGIVLAAVFGLSPTILINTLQAQADKYKGDLQGTAAHG